MRTSLLVVAALLAAACGPKRSPQVELAALMEPTAVQEGWRGVEAGDVDPAKALDRYLRMLPAGEPFMIGYGLVLLRGGQPIEGGFARVLLSRVQGQLRVVAVERGHGVPGLSTSARPAALPLVYDAGMSVGQQLATGGCEALPWAEMQDTEIPPRVVEALLRQSQGQLGRAGCGRIGSGADGVALVEAAAAYLLAEDGSPALVLLVLDAPDETGQWRVKALNVDRL